MAPYRSSSNKNETRLYAVAECQGGFFTAKQAETAGYVRNNHAYHVQSGKWERHYPGIFRLTHYPLSEHRDLILWSLWSRDQNDVPQGVFSHQTALSINDLSDLMPSKLHMTVPRKFRKGSKIPAILRLHFADLAPHEILERAGYRITRPIKTILDLIDAQEISDDLIVQGFSEARERGLITEREVRIYRDRLLPVLSSLEEIGNEKSSKTVCHSRSFSHST